jgi:broad specificity phosphatase PhoE
MSEFYLVRHGQASFGAADYDKLSDLGIQQSVWLGEYFAERDIKFSKLLCGTLTRHKETSAGICQSLQYPLDCEAFDWFNEFDFETVARAYLSVNPQHRPPENAPRSEFYRLLKRAMLEWSEDKLPKELLSESWVQFKQRLVEGVDHIQHNCADQKVLVVSSGGAISMLMSLVLGFNAENVINLNLQIKNASFSHFYFNQKTVRLSSFNNVPHLDHLQRADAITFS